MIKFDQFRNRRKNDQPVSESSATPLPPAVLTLKRVSYRIFPGNKVVALYQNDETGAMIAFPSVLQK